MKQIGIDNPTLGWCCPNTRAEQQVAGANPVIENKIERR